MRKFSPDLTVLILLAAGAFLGFLGRPPLFDWASDEGRISDASDPFIQLR